MAVPIPPDRAFVGVGANLGDARATVEAAIAELAALPGVLACRASPLYRSAPVDAGGPDFVNAVVELTTTLSPVELLSALHGLEAQRGRERPYRNAPRTLDLDLLVQGEYVSDDPSLTVPHPRLHLRAFVLRPLLDLAPHLHAPGLGRLADHLASVADQRIERLAP